MKAKAAPIQRADIKILPPIHPTTYNMNAPIMYLIYPYLVHSGSAS